MPIIKSSSKQAFKKNVETEMESGKPLKQALAISYDVKKRNKKMAKGGRVTEATASNPVSRDDKGWGAVIIKAKGGEVEHEMPMTEEERHDSIAAAVMARRKRMAEGGDVIDITDNAQEEPNQYYGRNEEILKENYDEDMEDVSQPMDSNLIDDPREEAESDKHDMIAQIRSRMNLKRNFR